MVIPRPEADRFETARVSADHNRPAHGAERRPRDADGYLVAAPVFIFEVSGSTASYDLNVKFELYRRHGVREYVVWRVYEAAIDWFALRDGALG
jgi:Uma2 family endonuclease